MIKPIIYPLRIKNGLKRTGGQWMITFKDLETANKTIKTTEIKGKDYAEVPQRIKAFRMIYPTGFIRTTMESNEGGVCVFKAEVGYYEELNPVVLGIGHAFEKQDSTFINKTSYIENCETSAVGRALGMAGFGIDVSVASAEEVQNAIANQDKKPQKKTNIKTEEEMKATETQTIDSLALTAVKARLAETSKQLGRTLDEEALCKMIGCESLDKMTYPQLRILNDNIDKWMRVKK